MRKNSSIVALIDSMGQHILDACGGIDGATPWVGGSFPPSVQGVGVERRGGSWHHAPRPVHVHVMCDGR
eukprot:scaffold129553_cov36-Tisochrysis_lutea.AAC.3